MASIRGTPDRLYQIDTEAEYIRAISGPEMHSAYREASGPQKKSLRDEIVLARLYGIDLFYSEYESQLTRERQQIGFLGTFTTIALTTTAAAVAANEAKTALAAVAAALSGTREAYDKDILIERTISLLQEQMRTQRKLMRTRILERLEANTQVYPLELALADIEAYYRAGTITGALIGVSEESAARLRTASHIEDEVIANRFAVTELGPSIRAFYRASLGNKAAVEDWLRQNNISVPVAFFLRSNAFAREQRRLVEDLGISIDRAQARSSPANSDNVRRERPNLPPRETSEESSATSVSAITNRIRRFWMSNSENKFAVENWLKANGITVLVGFFLSDRTYEADRQRMISELPIP